MSGKYGSIGALMPKAEVPWNEEGAFGASGPLHTWDCIARMAKKATCCTCRTDPDLRSEFFRLMNMGSE